MDRNQRGAKLSKLVESEGEKMLPATVFDSVSPGICANPDCNYTVEVEPDQNRGWCGACGTQTAQSAMILARYI